MNGPLFFKELNIPSTVEGLDTVLDLVKEIGISLKLDLEKMLSLHTVVVESVENAIIHGNRGIRDLNVHVSFIVTNIHIILEVEDKGDGFSFDTIPSPTLEVNLRKESGRGIFFIKSLSSDCYTIGKGNIIHIVIDR